ncbi:hypothetical protein EVAR_82265_1 [Eumeta japonica]|uniref:Uncharacterized protein n=1 Tax=Eumeta variegata TaxID=151549 RepID=A0A4C1VYG3_EUMVA|nr:hypothetical protein EVAR_82265_1 [Eumeta japonica]
MSTDGKIMLEISTKSANFSKRNTFVHLVLSSTSSRRVRRTRRDAKSDRAIASSVRFPDDGRRKSVSAKPPRCAHARAASAGLSDGRARYLSVGSCHLDVFERAVLRLVVFVFLVTRGKPKGASFR